MSDLELHVLGDLEVIRDGTVLDLPPSRKTRGLLAYLALSERTLRREQLCDLLWEIPDDPRGSLRWSLSKIRKLVDDTQHRRIIADRSSVSFDTSAMSIDVRNLHELAENGLQALPAEALQQAADQYRGGFLDGLDLPDFHDFYTWCIGQREHTSRSQAVLLRELLSRFEKSPERSLDYATRLVTLLPFDEHARASLISLLLRLDRKQEAEQQYRLGVQKLEEVGATDSGLLQRALSNKTNKKSGVEAAPERVSKSLQVALEPSASSHRDKTLIGREDELAALAGAINDLPRAEAARVVLISGDSGMGKSRLLQACAALAREIGAGILKASAFESEVIRPFAVWNDALRRAMPDNATSKMLSSGERVTRDQVFTSLSDVVSRETAKWPIVVLFDDVQWCDESSASAMHYVMRMNRRKPLLVVAAARDAELRENTPAQQVRTSLRSDGLLQEIKLEAMGTAQLQQLISQFAPGADASRLSQACGGNPLLAMELARAEVDGANAGTLSELMQDRMSRLDDDARTVLLWAAVLSPRISVPSLEQVTGLPRERIETGVDGIERQGILHPGERGFRFSHDLITRSIYQQISPARLQVMHRKVAELLEDGTSRDLQLAADLAHHAEKSGDPALAGRAMVSAGKLCLRFYANEDALELYEKGLEFATRLEESDRVCLTLQLHDIRLNAAPLEDWEAKVEEYIDLAEQALDYGALPFARLGYQMASYVRWLHGQWSDAQRDSLQAERVSRTASDEAHIFGMAEAAKCLAMLERDLSQADAMAMEAGAVAARQNIQCPAVPISLGILRYYEGRLDDAVDHLEDARTLCKTQGDRASEYLANEYLAMVEVERDDYAAAAERCQVLVDIGSRLREGSEYAFALALQALCQYGLDGERDQLEMALSAVREADAKQRLAYLLNRAAILDMRYDRTEPALERATEALALAQHMERPSETLLAHINLAKLSLYFSELDDTHHVNEIKKLTAGTVAQWARKNASPLMIKQ